MWDGCTKKGISALRSSSWRLGEAEARMSIENGSSDRVHQPAVYKGVPHASAKAFPEERRVLRLRTRLLRSEHPLLLGVKDHDIGHGSDLDGSCFFPTHHCRRI